MDSVLIKIYTPQAFHSLQPAQELLVAEGAALSVQTTVLVVTVRYGASLMTVFNICVAVNTAPAESGGGGGITLASACVSIG